MRRGLALLLFAGAFAAFAVPALLRVRPAVHPVPRAAAAPVAPAAAAPSSTAPLFVNETPEHRYDTFWKGSLKIAREQSGIEFALILLKGLPPGETLEKLAVRRFAEAGLARSTGGRGVLLLYVEAEHAMKIEVGYSLEPVFTDLVARRYEEAAKSFILSGAIGDFMTEIMVTMVKHYQLGAGDELWGISAPPVTASLSSRFLSGGAGTLGHGYAQTMYQSLAEIRARTKAVPAENLKPSADARETVERYLSSLEAGLGDPELPLLTEGSRLFRVEYLRNASYQRRTHDFYRRALPYQLQLHDGLGVAIFKEAQPVWPIYLRKDPHGLWQVDEAGAWARNHLYENINHPFHKHADDPFAFAWTSLGRWKPGDVLYPGRAKDFVPLPDPGALLPELRKREAELAANPGDPARYFALGDLLYFEAYWQAAAIELYTRGLALAPDRLEYRWRLIEIYPNLCLIEPWLAEYEEILKRTPGDELARKQYEYQKGFYGPLMDGPSAPVSEVFEASAAPAFWPPRLGEKFPELELRDAQGGKRRLSALLADGATLIEPVGMTCEACNAFSGGHKKGGFGGIAPQADLKSIEESFEAANGAGSFHDPRLGFIQLVLYSSKMGPVSRADAEAWRDHFGVDRPLSVIAGGAAFLSPPLEPASNAMIPGFFLLDHQGMVVADATGHAPRNNLFRELIPKAGSILAAFKTGAPSAGSPPRAPASVLAVGTTPEIDQAYAWIPHHQTTYAATRSTLDAEHAAGLAGFFHSVDLAIVARVKEMRVLQAKQVPAPGGADYAAILAALRAPTAAGPPAAVAELVAGAVEEQRAFLEEWKGAVAQGRPQAVSGPHVALSSERLHRAYELLMRSFPNESPENHQAFFDHLCALDFK